MTKLLDAGAAPRRALRYKVKPGWVEWVELDVATALTVTVNGALQPRTTLPTKRVLWKLEAKEVTSEGDVMLGFTVANVELLKGDQVPERSLFSYRWQPFGSTPRESTSSVTSGASTRGSASIGTASRRSG